MLQYTFKNSVILTSLNKMQGNHIHC